MAATKAQVVVWGLIAGLSVWGVTTLSRVKLPDETPAVAQAASVSVVEQKPRAVVPAPALAALPATIPEFPFPDELVGEPEMIPEAGEASTEAESFVEIPSDAIPNISTFEDQVETVAEISDLPEPVPAPELASVTVGEPPIPMPGRPMAARPVEAVPLSEVKTLYVVADMLNVRAVPSTTGPVLQRVAQGFAVAPRQQADEWIGFLMQDGTTGWMRTDYLSDTMPPPSQAPATETVTQPLNLMM